MMYITIVICFLHDLHVNFLEYVKYGFWHTFMTGGPYFGVECLTENWRTVGSSFFAKAVNSDVS
jgi:hypothetical protein